MPQKPPKTGPNQAEHQRRAAEALRENLRRRKEQQRKARPEAPVPALPEEADQD